MDPPEEVSDASWARRAAVKNYALTTILVFIGRDSRKDEESRPCMG